MSLASKGGVGVATQSIFKSVHIRDRAAGKRLVRALESSRKQKREPIVFQRSYSDMTTDEMQKVFGKRDDRL